MDPPTPIEPPPPAYNEEQQEYDRKVSDALQQSLRVPPPLPLSSAGEDTWEEWDEAKFEAAVRAREHGGSNAEIPHRSSEKDRLAREDAAQSQASAQASSSRSPPHVRTGSVGRRLPASPPGNVPANISTKERPSWFAQAQLDTPAPVQEHHHHHLPPEEDEPDEQLPAFTAVGPSLEGPPFEEVMRMQPRTNVGPGDSPPQSPLDSVDGLDSPPHPTPWAVPTRPSSHGGYFDEHVPHSPPPPAQRTDSATVRSPRPPNMSFDQAMSPRLPPPSFDHSRSSRPPPVSSNQSRSPRPPPMPSAQSRSPRPPPMPFDQSMAYTKTRTLPTESEEKPAGPVNASAFYNSSVSSFLGGPSNSQAPKKTHTLNRGPFSNASSGAGSYTPRTSDPYAPRVAEQYARQASDPYAPVPPPGPAPFPSQGNMYDTYPPPLPSHPPQQQPYPPHQQQPYQQQPYPPQQQPYPPQQQPYPPQHQPYPPQHQPYSPQQQPYSPPQQPYHNMYGTPTAGPGPVQGLWTQHRDPGRG